jgi:hypothetical protein
MKTWQKLMLFFGVIFLLAVYDANAQVPTLKTVTTVITNRTTTITLAGKGFKSGMVLVLNSVNQYMTLPTKVINQYKATAVVTLTKPEDIPIHVTLKGNLSNVITLQVVDPLKIETTTLPDAVCPTC